MNWWVVRLILRWFVWFVETFSFPISRLIMCFTNLLFTNQILFWKRNRRDKWTKIFTWGFIVTTWILHFSLCSRAVLFSEWFQFSKQIVCNLLLNRTLSTDLSSSCDDWSLSNHRRLILKWCNDSCRFSLSVNLI